MSVGGNGREGGFVMAGDARSGGGYGSRGPGASGQGGQGYAGPPQGPLAYGPEAEPEGLTLRDYLAVIWRRAWLIILVVLLATASAYYLANRQPKRYSASATIIYKQQMDLVNPYGGSYTDTVGLDRESGSISALLAGPDLQELILEILDRGTVDQSPGYGVSATPQESSNVVVFTGDSTSARLAAAGANAAARAYVDWNKNLEKAQISRAIEVLEGQLGKYQTAKSKLSGDYVMLRSSLQELQILEVTASGNYRIVSPARPPTTPYAPTPMRSAFVGLGVGLFAGIGLAFLLEQFDTRIRRPDQIAQILRQPLLGRVPRISRKLLGESALVTLKHPEGHVAESFRMVRTNLDFMAVDADVRSLVVTSCIKGEGKSVTLANLGVSMAMAGKKVVVVDADLRRPRMHKYFGLQNEVGVSTVATGQHGLFTALQPVAVQPVPGEAGSENGVDFERWAQGSEARSRLYVLTSGPIPPNPGEIVASRRFGAIVKELTTEADIVLVDSPAMLAVGDTSSIAAKVDGLLFLVDMQMVKRPQLLTAADQLFRLPVTMLGTVLRMHAKRGERYYYHSPSYYYSYTYSDEGRRIKRKAPSRPAPELPAPLD